jgi:hypothetical protein
MVNDDFRKERTVTLCGIEERDSGFFGTLFVWLHPEAESDPVWLFAKL